MPRWRKLLMAMTATVLLSSAAVARAGVVTVANAGFETFTQNGVNKSPADGQFMYFNGNAGNTGLSGTLAVPGWSVLNETGLNGGLYNPAIGVTSGGAAPEGTTAAFFRQNYTIGQTLAATVQANTIYTLSVAVQRRTDVAFGDYVLEMWAGADRLAYLQNGMTAWQAPAAGEWVDVSLVFDSAGVTPAWYNRAVQVRLVGGPGSAQVLMDNVRFSTQEIAAAVPEPAAAAVMAFIAGAAAMRRRR